MHFQIRKNAADPSTLGESPLAITTFEWVLEKKDGAVCRSARRFKTEPEARSDIAAAKKTMKGATRAKVLSPGEEPS